MLRNTALTSFVVAAVLAISLRAPSARAEAEEWALTLAPGVWYAVQALSDDVEVASLAPLARVGVRYGLTDFWYLGGSVAGGVALSADHDPAFVGDAHLEVAYFIDAIEWVLYGVGAVGVLLRGQHPDVLLDDAAGVGADLSVIVGVGLDYRPARDWSIGATFRYQLVVTDLDRTVPSFEAGLVYTRYWE